MAPYKFTPGWYRHTYGSTVAFYTHQPRTPLEGPYPSQEAAEEAVRQAQADHEVNVAIARALGYAPEPGWPLTWSRGVRDQPGWSSHTPGPIPYTDNLTECARACRLLGLSWDVQERQEKPDSPWEHWGEVWWPSREDRPRIFLQEGLSASHALALAVLALLKAEGKA